MKRYYKKNFWSKGVSKKIEDFIYFIIIAIIVLALFGCKSFYLRKAMEKNPILFTDTIVLKEYPEKDTIFLTEKKDTIFFNNQNKVFTRIYRHYDTLRIEQKIKSDTIYINKVEIKKEVKPNFAKQMFYYLLILTFLVVVIKIALK